MNKKNKVSLVILSTTFTIICLLLAAWLLTDSVVIQAELYDSIVDFLYSLIIVSGFLLARRDRTPKYPEGLIRLEPLIASLVGFIVIGTGSFIIYNSIQRLMGTGSTTFSSIAVGILILSTGLKLALFYYVRQKAVSLNSSSLYATSVDLRNDVLTHIGSIIGFLLVLTQYAFIEAVIAILISTYILFSGLKLIQQNIPNLLGFSIDAKQKQELKQTASSHPQVHGIHGYEVHFTGDYIDISMHLEVNGDLSITEGHKIEIEVADQLRNKAQHPVNEINLHLDPDTLNEWEDKKRL